jgi:7-cyano-7-deazaguanine synthase
VLSGGIDSTAALAVFHGDTPLRAISFDYGQRHVRELDAARAVARHYDIPHQVIDIPILHGSALLGPVSVPDGHYAEDTMKATVVPGRNFVFVATAVAQGDEGDTVVFGVHAGDHPIYPDCRPAFWDAVASAASAYDVAVSTPFIDIDKAGVVAAGARADAPFALTWSCYKGGDVHCGKCGTCVERAEAFSLAGVDDPTEYADPLFWRTATEAWAAT